MKIEAKLVMSYETHHIAKKIQETLSIDDANFVISEVKGTELHAKIHQNSLSSFLQTIDDYLSCLSVAEQIIAPKGQHKDNEKNL